MTLRYLLKFMVLPPLANLLLLVAAALVWHRFPRLARGMAVASVVSLWLLATPWVSSQLMAGLENHHPRLTPAELMRAEADAIVVLSGGIDAQGTEFGFPVADLHTLARLRYAAFAHRQTGLPILVSGGSVFDDRDLTLAEAMANDLVRNFNVQARWLEGRSRTTAENARYSAEMLAASEVDRVLLVTQGFHMPRAVYSFEQAGLAVVAAPTGRTGDSNTTLLDWVPTALALHNSTLALHEYLGLIVYRLTG